MSETSVASYWLIRVDGQFVVSAGAPPETVFPRGQAGAFGDPDAALLVGEWQGWPCYSIEVESVPDSIPGEPMPVRSVFGVAGAEAFAIVCRASQLLDWKKNHRYCGRCSTPTTMTSIMAMPRLSGPKTARATQ